MTAPSPYLKVWIRHWNIPHFLYKSHPLINRLPRVISPPLTKNNCFPKGSYFWGDAISIYSFWCFQMIFIHFIAVPSPKNNVKLTSNSLVTLLWASGARVVLWWDKLFTVPYFPKGSSRLNALRYRLPSCMSVKTTWGAGETTHHPPVWLGFESWHRCHVGWVCCWFSLSLSLGGFSLGAPVFTSL